MTTNLRMTLEDYVAHQKRVKEANRRRHSCNLANLRAPALDMGEPGRLLRKCKMCGVEFNAMSNGEQTAIFCSFKCRGKHYSGPNNINWNGGRKSAVCAGCGKKYTYGAGDKGIVCSLKCWGKVKSVQMLGRGYTRARGGRREDLNNQYFRSAWEANWARYLNWLKAAAQIKDWQFEPDTFEFVGIKRGNRCYTPDFKIFENDGSENYHEVKGWMDPKSQTKLKRMARFHPRVKITVIDLAAYRSVASTFGRSLPHWEHKHDQRRPLRSVSFKRKKLLGEAHPQAKLTDEAIRLIRASKETHKVIASYFGASQSNISRIKLGKAWGHIPDSDVSPDSLQLISKSGEFCGPIRPKIMPRGEQHSSSKLSENDVREIRKLRAEGWKLVPLAARYGITAVCARYVIIRKTWRHVA